MKPAKYVFIVLSACLLVSCYSVRLKNVNGAPELDPVHMTDDYYNGMSVVVIDTVISMNVTSKDFTYLIKGTDACPSGKINIIEYRNTFGGLLLNTITFGRKRKVKIIYVCEKPSN